MPLVTIPKKELTSFDLPAICVISGATEGVVWKKRKLQWYPPWVAAFAVSPPLMILAMLIAMKRVEGELPFTEETWAALRRAEILRVVAIFLGIFGVVGAMGIAAATKEPLLGLFVFVLTLGAAIWMGVQFVRKRSPITKKITEEVIEIEIPSEVAAQAFHARLYGNRQAHAPR